MKEAADKFDVPVVDLFTMSRAFLEKTGDEASKKYYMNLVPGEASWAPEGKNDIHILSMREHCFIPE